MLTVGEVLLLLMMVVFFVWVGLIEWRIYKLTGSLQPFFRGRGRADVELMLRDLLVRLDRADDELKRMSTRMTALESKQPLNVQHVGVVRYNPFADTGGDQSFVIALLDDHSDGILLNGLHARNESRLYAKPVVGGVSTYPLTNEEKEAIQRALSKGK